MTVTEIAKQAGVSIATVDRVLHNRGRVSAETKASIEKIIKDSGYQPDPLARHLKKRCQYHIGVLIPKPQSALGYWQQIYNGILNTVQQELSVFSFKVEPYFFIRADKNSLFQAFKSMISSSCAAYIIAPIMQKEIKKLLTMPNVVKPYCFVDSPLPDCQPLSEIVQNPHDAGFCAGRLTQLFSKKDGTFIVVKPHEGAFNLDERAKGFLDWFLQQNKSKNQAVCVTKKIQIETIDKTINELFNSYQNIAGICSVSVETLILAKAIQKIDTNHQISVTGFDMVTNNRQGLLTGEIDALIDQNPFEQGVLAVRQIFKKLVYEESVDKEISMPIEIFLKENV